MEYIVFSDESYISAERFRSIGAISYPKAFDRIIQSELGDLLRNSEVREFKWKKLKDAKYRFCALKIIDYLFRYLGQRGIRVDVIVWDTQDARHKIAGRDDIANFERMFFHLMKNLMKRREKDSSWCVYPDERMDIHWDVIRRCLGNVGKWREYFESGLFGDAFSDHFFHIRAFGQAISIESPPTQIADLFAGLAVFSRNAYGKFKKWCDNRSQQLSFLHSKVEPKCTNREAERFRVLEEFINCCKNRKVGVSIDSKKCLSTFNPANPINFWNYAPQHPEDKAPVR